MNLYLELFLAFAKVGLFTFGGGYAMLAVIEHACVEEHHWITHDEMMDIAVIAESTPGPISINCATYTGFKQKGFLGALAATLGIVTPSFLVIYLISIYLDHFLEITWIANAFRGIKLAVGLLILDAALKMIRKMKKKPFPVTVMVCAAAIMMAGDLVAIHFSTIALMLAAGAISLLLYLVENSCKKGGLKA